MEVEATVSNVLLHIQCTKYIKDKITAMLLLPDITESLREKLKKYKDADTVPFSLIREMSKQSTSDGTFYLHELMHDSDIVLPKYIAPPRDPELDKRIQHLKLEQMNQEYRRMTKNVTCGNDQKVLNSFGDEVKSVQKMLITILNFILTVAGAFAFAYKATEYSLEVPNMSLQVCAGLIVGTIVFFADLYFVMKHEMVEEGTISKNVYDK